MRSVSSPFSVASVSNALRHFCPLRVPSVVFVVWLTVPKVVGVTRVGMNNRHEAIVMLERVGMTWHEI